MNLVLAQFYGNRLSAFYIVSSWTSLRDIIRRYVNIIRYNYLPSYLQMPTTRGFQAWCLLSKMFFIEIARMQLITQWIHTWLPIENVSVWFQIIAILEEKIAEQINNVVMFVLEYVKNKSIKIIFNLLHWKSWHQKKGSDVCDIQAEFKRTLDWCAWKRLTHAK